MITSNFGLQNEQRLKHFKYQCYPNECKLGKRTLHLKSMIKNVNTNLIMQGIVGWQYLYILFLKMSRVAVISKSKVQYCSLDHPSWSPGSFVWGEQHKSHQTTWLFHKAMFKLIWCSEFSKVKISLKLSTHMGKTLATLSHQSRCQCMTL